MMDGEKRGKTEAESQEEEKQMFMLCFWKDSYL